MLARLEAIQPAVLFGRRVVQPGIEREDADRLQAMALADLVVVEVVCRSDLDRAAAELRVDVLVGNDRDGASGKRQLDALADHRAIALILGMHRDRHVAQHGLRTRGRHADRTLAVRERIAQLPELAVFFRGVDLEVGDCGAEHRVPVHQTLAAVDEAFLVEAHENFHHGARHLGVHGEVARFLSLGVGVLPVGRGTEAAHLPRDGRARLLLPSPDALDEFLAPEVVAALALFLELALDHDLRGDAGVVGADHPVGVEAAHAMEADQRVHQGLLERMAHVQRAGDVRRRQLDAVRRFAVIVMAEVAARFPALVPALLDRRGIEALVQHYFGGIVDSGSARACATDAATASRTI